MKVGFRISGVPHDRVLTLAARLGFTALEPEWSVELSPTFPALGRMARDLGIELSAVLTGMDPMGPDDFRRAFDDCALIGAGCFVAHPRPLGLEDPRAQAEFQERFAEAARLGETLGVRLALHSCGLGPEQWDLMFRLVPALALKYDPSFSAQAGRNYAAEVFKYGRRIAHVHAKDEMILGRTTDYSQGLLPMTYAPPGMGEIRWGTVIAALYEVGFDAQIAIEPHSAYWCGEGYERGLILAKRHLEQFLA